ncbi:hypothetical protein [Azospirillum sp.]|uniref:hypothetical protein n=1 Tax=Azospirillum sp. TaxID=34012 RepID=UPI003D71E51A
MTLPADRIGDNGQRYEVRGYIEETDVVEPIGYANDKDGADQLRDAANLWPRYDTVWVVDRQPQPPINERATSGGSDA